MSEAWERWPEHRGHNLGRSMGDVVCATCGYEVLEKGTQPPGPRDNEVIYPYWTS